MGRIAPRKRRKNNRIYQPLLHTWLTIRQKILPDAKNSDDQNLMPEVTTPVQEHGIKRLLLKIWHLPDAFHWMEPLPFFHRRWVIIATTVFLLALLWPVSRDNTNLFFPVNTQPTDVPLQAQLQGNIDTLAPPTLATEMPPPPPQGNWQNYQIQSGKTLAQLFRDNNLPVNAAFAMAQVEGSDKPLSNLQVGQEVKIMLDAQGGITALAIATTNSVIVLFTRQSDGSYRREY
jgi:uncharacterized protein